MFEHNDMYMVKLQLDYLTEYLQAFVDSYKAYINFNQKKINPSKVNILDLYKFSNPVHYVNISDTLYRTKWVISSDKRIELPHRLKWKEFSDIAGSSSMRNRAIIFIWPKRRKIMSLWT